MRTDVEIEIVLFRRNEGVYVGCLRMRTRDGHQEGDGHHRVGEEEVH